MDIKKEVTESGETTEITIKEELYETIENDGLNRNFEDISMPKSRLLENSIKANNVHGYSIQGKSPAIIKTEIKTEPNDDYEVDPKSEILAVSCDPKLESQVGSICDIVEKDPLKVENVYEPKLETNESIHLENTFHSKIVLCPIEQDALVMQVDTVHEEKKARFPM